MWFDDGTATGALVTITNGTSLSFDLHTDQLAVANQANAAITNGDLATAIGVGDRSLSAVYNMSGSTLVMTGSTLEIQTGSTFTPGAEVKVHNVDIDGTFHMGTNDVTVTGSWDATGGSFDGDNNVTFQTDRPQIITSNGSAFSRVTFKIPHIGAVGTWISTDELTVTSTQTVTITSDISSALGPQFSDISVTAGDTSGTGSWITSQQTTTRFLYGTSSGSLTSEIDDGALSYDHSLALTNLAPGTKYYYQIVATNDENQTTTSSVFTFNTLSQQLTQDDLDAAEAAGAAAAAGGSVTIRRYDDCTQERLGTPFALADLKADVREAGSGSVVVTWTTNKTAASLINYGTQSSAERYLYNIADFVTEHSFTLTGLRPSTTYHLQAASFSMCGEMAISTEITFVSPASSSQSAAEIAAEGEGAHKPSAEESKTIFTSVLKKLLDLAQKASVNLTVSDLKEALQDQEALLKELASRVPGPVLGGEPKVTITNTAATVTWTTDEPADSLVSFNSGRGFDGSTYAENAGDPKAAATDHTVTIARLTPGTLYHFRIQSTTPIGAVTTSKDFTFTTSQVQLAILTHNEKILSAESALFRFDTNVPTTTAITVTPYRGDTPDSSLSRKYDSKSGELTTTHSLEIDDFDSGTLYDVELSGKDDGGDTASLMLRGFATGKTDAPPEVGSVQTDAAIAPGKESRIQAVVSWQTSKAATSRVLFEKGISTDPAHALELSTPLDASYTKKHVVLLPSLEPGIVYSFRVESVDLAGHTTLSKIFTILTPRQEQGIIAVIVKQMEDASDGSVTSAASNHAPS